MTDRVLPASPPAVSVVIPAYNRAATICAAMESVLRQTYADFELLIVDDCSSDGTLDAAARLSDPRIRLIKSPENAGASAARNRGSTKRAENGSRSRTAMTNGCRASSRNRWHASPPRARIM